MRKLTGSATPQILFFSGCDHAVRVQVERDGAQSLWLSSLSRKRSAP